MIDNNIYKALLFVVKHPRFSSLPRDVISDIEYFREGVEWNGGARDFDMEKVHRGAEYVDKFAAEWDGT